MVGRMRNTFTLASADRSGATAIEYGLIAGLISILCIGWATSIGTSVSNFFTGVTNGF